MGIWDTLGFGGGSQEPEPDEDRAVHLIVEQMENELESLSASMEQLTESASNDKAARLFADRQLEDLAWEVLDKQLGKFDDRPESRRRYRKRAHRYFREDPIVGQAVQLRTWYTFGRGVPQPTVPKPVDNDNLTSGAVEKVMAAKSEKAVESALREFSVSIKEAEESPNDEHRRRAQKVLDAFWKAPENRAVLTSLAAQERLSNDLQLDGEIFLALFDGDGKEREEAEVPPTLLLGRIDPDEIKNIISSAENDAVPLWYVRSYAPYAWNFKTDAWDIKPTRVIYYQDWENEPLEDDPDPRKIKGIDNEDQSTGVSGGEESESDGQMRLAGPDDVSFKGKGTVPGYRSDRSRPGKAVSNARIMHIRTNGTSGQQRGESELKRVLEWAKGFNEFMDARLAIARAMNKIAQKVTVEGGSTEVNKVIQALKGGDALAITRTPKYDEQVSRPEAATWVQNRSMDIQPMSFETGAGSAAADRDSFLGQIAAGTNWPKHYLGGDGAAALASAVSMELPTLKSIESRQELWEMVILGLSKEALKRAGISDVEPEINMPAILQRDLGAITAALATMKEMVDPLGQIVPMLRFLLREALSAMGITNISELMDDILPEGYVPPPPMMPGMDDREEDDHEAGPVKKETRKPGGIEKTQVKNAQTGDTARSRAQEPRRGRPDDRGVPR